MKSRYINTRFWSDTFVSELSPTEKLIFLYFLTNQYTTISGIYEVTIKTVSFETGVPLDEVEIIMAKLEPKIIYAEGYIIIKNFYKHQQRNPNIDKGIAESLKELPRNVVTRLHELNFPYSDLVRRATPKDTFVNAEQSTTVIGKEKDYINAIFDCFYEINPTLNYGNKTHRAAVTDMLKKYRFQELKKIAEYAVSINGQPYTPVITTPLDLKNKLAQLMTFYKKEMHSKPVIV
jgi:hypothetical protein